MGRFLTACLRVVGRRIGASATRNLTTVRQSWLSFWFAEVDPTLLGIIRIIAGGMILYTHLVWSLGLDGFLGPDGWQGRELMSVFQDSQVAISFWNVLPPDWLWPIHLVCLALLLMFVLGMATPVTAWLAYIITVSYAYRAQMANFGLDQINAMLAFYLAIGPCGASLSFDRWWRTRQAQKTGQPIDPPKPSAAANLSLRLIQVHLCIIYLFAGISKLQGELWWNGFAVWNAAANLEYQSGDLTWLAYVPWFCNLLTIGTIFWEISFWALVWNKTLRLPVLLIGVLMHLGIGAFLGMWTFGLAMIFAYLSFIPPESAPGILRFFPDLIEEAACPSKVVPESPKSLPDNAASCDT